jgi:hypothetical protein
MKSLKHSSYPPPHIISLSGSYIIYFYFLSLFYCVILMSECLSVPNTYWLMNGFPWKSLSTLVKSHCIYVSVKFLPWIIPTWSPCRLPRWTTLCKIILISLCVKDQHGSCVKSKFIFKFLFWSDVLWNWQFYIDIQYITTNPVWNICVNNGRHTAGVKLLNYCWQMCQSRDLNELYLYTDWMTN